MVNDTEFGLTAYFYSGDIIRIWHDAEPSTPPRLAAGAEVLRRVRWIRRELGVVKYLT